MKAGPQQLAQAFEAAEIAFTDGACGFHLDADEVSATLHDDVNFITVLVT